MYTSYIQIIRLTTRVISIHVNIKSVRARRSVGRPEHVTLRLNAIAQEKRAPQLLLTKIMMVVQKQGNAVGVGTLMKEVDAVPVHIIKIQVYIANVRIPLLLVEVGIAIITTYKKRRHKAFSRIEEALFVFRSD